MKYDYPDGARQKVQQAAKALKKPFKAAMAAGMHPDEFWYWLGDEVEPRRKIRPRWVSLANDGKKRRAAKARFARTNQLCPRNQRIRALCEVELQEGKPLKSIYPKIKKMKNGVGERQAREICKAEREAFRKKTRT